MVSFTHAQNIIVGRHCTRGDHYLYVVIYRSRDALSASEKEEQFASNENISLVYILKYQVINY